MTGRRTLTADLYRTDRYGADKNPPPTDAHAFVVWLEQLMHSVPEEYRTSVFIEFDDDGDYDSPRPELRVYWTRPETDKELSDRIEKERTYADLQKMTTRAQELKVLSALKAKYEHGA